MRVALALSVAVVLGGCDEKTETEEQKVADAGTAAPAADAALNELIEARKALYIAKNDGKEMDRRKKCLELEPKFSEWEKISAMPTKRDENLGQVKGLCGELLETRVLMAKAAEAKPELNLSPALEKIFNFKALKTSFAKAKKAARKGDPKEDCDKALLTAQHLEARKKKLKRKEKKLVKKTRAFCTGPGAKATIRFQLKAAEGAAKDGNATELAKHCVAVLTTMQTASGKLDKLEEQSQSLCIEAHAMKDMLAKK